MCADRVCDLTKLHSSHTFATSRVEDERFSLCRVHGVPVLRAERPALFLRNLFPTLLSVPPQTCAASSASAAGGPQILARRSGAPAGEHGQRDLSSRLSGGGGQSRHVWGGGSCRQRPPAPRRGPPRPLQSHGVVTRGVQDSRWAAGLRHQILGKVTRLGHLLGVGWRLTESSVLR